MEIGANAGLHLSFSHCPRMAQLCPGHRELGCEEVVKCRCKWHMPSLHGESDACRTGRSAGQTVLLAALPAGLWGFVLAVLSLHRGGGTVTVTVQALCGCCGSEDSALATGRMHPVFICAWCGVKSLERM